MSSEYSWTTDHIFGLTMREISWRIGAIHERLGVKAQFDARLHGMEMKGAKRNEKQSLSIEQEEKLSNLAEKRIQKCLKK